MLHVKNIAPDNVNNAEDLDIAMSMYHILEYSDNYSMTSGSLWNCLEIK